MHCKKAKTLFVQYLENELNESVKAEFLSHLETCSNCASELKFISDALGSVSGFAQAHPETSGYFTVKTLQKIDLLKKSEQTLLQWIIHVLFKKPAVVAASVAALFAGVMLGIFFNLQILKRSDVNTISEMQTMEEIYLAGTSDDYMIQFIENQYYKNNGDQQK